MENKTTILSSIRRAFRPSSTKVNGKSPVSKRKELSIRVFPEENETRRYEDVSNFDAKPLPRPLPETTSKQKKSRRPKHTMSETRRGQQRPVSSAIRAGGTVLGTNVHQTKSATLPSGVRVARPAPPPPVNHTIRIPPPRHSRKLPLSSPASPVHHRHGVPQFHSYLQPLPHTVSSLDCSVTTPTASQHKTAINISRTGPSTLPYEYSQWVPSSDQKDGGTNNHYSSIPPRPTDHQYGYRSSAWNDTKCDDNHFQHGRAGLQVSASMIELRGAGTDSDNGYMEINRSTLELPTVASDYQQPIALRRLPGPPLAVKERQQRREEQRLLRGTIVVLDENKTLEI